MKFLQFLFRVGFSLFTAFIVSFSSAVIFFDFSGYENASDRAFLVVAPTLAIAFLLFEAFPKFWTWLAQRQVPILIVFGVFAVLGAVAVVLPVAISNVYYLGMLAFAIALFALMLPAVPAVERVRSTHSMRHYFLGFVLSLFFVYGTMGLLGGARDNIQQCCPIW